MTVDYSFEFIIENMVPISFIVDAFGADYAWGAQTKILSIYY